MITSAHNPRIKWLKGLQSSSRQRRAEGVCVIEGVRLAEEALAAGWPARLVLYGEAVSPRGQAVVDGFAARGAEVEAAAEHVLQAAADTDSPQGLVVALEARPLPLPERLGFVLLADRMRDPGNLGAMVRTAAAAGMDGVICPPETVDAFSPKVLRAGMGAHFRLPVWPLGWDEIERRLSGLAVFIAAAGEGPAYDRADLIQPLALVLGGEAEGVGEQARRLATSPLHIPMPGGSESLNAAVAAGILIFEAVRQRRSKTT
ncbi:MAG: TrmH family RNA methyltransferase [Chloroflexota bacterium]